ncbi:MAG: hypothetical protein P9M13_00915 [Candidatus Ancaeobacter aquaticus]|nr:hypothetical protein [Candidatus Ancaeobacter aquaticus]
MKKIIISILVYALSLGIAQAESPSYTLPEKAVCVLMLKVKSDDPGIHAILDKYKKWFLNEKLGADARTVVEDFNVLEFDEIALGLIPDEKGKPTYLAIGDMSEKDASVTFKYKNVNLKLNIKERKDEKGLQQGIIKALLDTWLDDSDIRKDDEGILYSKLRESRGEISSYAFFKNRVIIGSNYGIVKEAKTRSLPGAIIGSQKKNYAEFLRNLDKNDDGYFYIDNKSGYFTNFIRVREEVLRIPLLLSGDVIEFLGIFFDIVNKNAINARILFQGKNEESLKKIVVDARFMAEFFKRKMLVDNIGCTYRIVKRGNAVIVKIKLNNVEPLLNKLLKVQSSKNPA